MSGSIMTILFVLPVVLLSMLLPLALVVALLVLFDLLPRTLVEGTVLLRWIAGISGIY